MRAKGFFVLRFLLTRVLPVVLAFLLFVSGMFFFQQTMQEVMNVEDEEISIERIKIASLTQPNAPFKGTDLEPFDIESFTTAEIVLSAFKKAYPSKIANYGYDEKARDWFIMVGKTKFLWAKGRILLKEFVHEVNDWRPYVDYIYTNQIPNPTNFTPELVEEIKRTTHPDYRQTLPPYNQDFFDALYDGKTQNQIERHIVSTTFLEKKVNLHQDIVPELKRVEKRILEEAKTNQEVQEFISTIANVEGYNWRTIRDRQDRSFHSWGLALDILPKGWSQKNLYWSWARDWNPNWMMIPLDKRWTPPPVVIEIFEYHGFVWGGNWIQWDNIHFEFRPELIILRSKT